MNPAMLGVLAKLGVAGLAVGALMWVIKMQEDRARSDRADNVQLILEALKDVEDAHAKEARACWEKRGPDHGR